MLDEKAIASLKSLAIAVLAEPHLDQEWVARPTAHAGAFVTTPDFQGRIASFIAGWTGTELVDGITRAKYAVACHPSVIIELISRLERLQAENARLQESLDDEIDQNRAMREYSGLDLGEVY